MSNVYRKWCFWYIYEFERSDEKKKKNKGETITVSLEKLKCAKTDSPTCKLYWLIVKYKIYSGLQAGKFQYNKLFICKSSNAYIEHLSLWSTRSAALPHVKLMIIVNSLGFENWGYSSIWRGDRVGHFHSYHSIIKILIFFCHINQLGKADLSIVFYSRSGMPIEWSNKFCEQWGTPLSDQVFSGR